MTDLNCTCESNAAKDCPVVAHHPKPIIVYECDACGRALPGCRAVGHPQYGVPICVRDTAGCAKLAKQFKRLGKKLGLNLADLLTIQRAADTCWSAIGPDIMDASGIPSTSGKTVSRALVVEVVLDNYTYFRESDYLTGPAKKALDYSDPLYNSKAVAELVKGAFPEARWGW